MTAESQQPGSICIVAVDLAHLVQNGGIGSSNWLLAQVLARSGWRVHILYCGPLEDPGNLARVGRRLGRAGIALHWLEDFPLPAEHRVPGVSQPPYVERSDQVRYALEQLHQQHRFDLAEFAEWGAVGFRPVQAKRAGLALADLPLAVKLHSPSYWLREGNLQWMQSADDLQRDFCERYAFEQADLQLSPCRYMLDYVRTLGWNVRPDALVLPNVFPPLQRQAPAAPEAQPEIVFFGRLETRKGLELLLEAIAPLDPDLPVTFLGKDTRLPGGRPASEHIQKRLAGRRVRLLTNLDRQQALDYLGGPNRLAVIASLVDNFPNTVLECAIGGIPFLASRVGGIPEILDDPALNEPLLFEPTAADLRRCLKGYLQTPLQERRRLVQQARRATDVADNHRRIVRRYQQILQSKRSPAGGTGSLSASGQPAEAIRPTSPHPLVTLAVPYYNLPDFLPQTLESLARQSYPNLEVLVLDDGSTEPEALRVLEQQKQRYGQFRFLSQPNAGLGAARNAALHQARGEFFLPVDADNVACAHMVQRFVAAMLRNPHLSALTCYYLVFRRDEDLKRRDYLYAYRPTGGPHVMASFLNVYGDANAIFRTEHLRAVGGYETDPDTTCEDWELFVKLVHDGFQIDVLPEVLFYYRFREDSLIRVTNTYRNHQRVLRQYFQSDRLSQADRVALWTAFVSLQKFNRPLRYRFIDQVSANLRRVPLAHALFRRFALSSMQHGSLTHRAWRLCSRLSASFERLSGPHTKSNGRAAGSLKQERSGRTIEPTIPSPSMGEGQVGGDASR